MCFYCTQSDILLYGIARFSRGNKNNQPQTKFTGSYKRKECKRRGLTFDFYSFECLNHSNVTFGMSHANSIDFNTGSQYNVK